MSARKCQIVKISSGSTKRALEKKKKIQKILDLVHRLCKIVYICHQAGLNWNRLFTTTLVQTLKKPENMKVIKPSKRQNTKFHTWNHSWLGVS